jgi:SAM-dependent methyltransferase
MDEKEVAGYWDDNAENFARYARQGYDVYRDFVNAPAFLALLPEIRNFAGLDVGCGEGHHTRELARRGAQLKGIDMSATFIQLAEAAEQSEPLGITYVLGSGSKMPFAADSFDFVISTMCLMDSPSQEETVQEIFRVCKPGGFFQFSISHPCFFPTQRKSVRDEEGKEIAVQVSGYFNEHEPRIESWFFSAAPPDVRSSTPPFQTPIFHRTMSSWLNLLIDSGFIIERLQEPRASIEAVAAWPLLSDTNIVAYFLHVRCRKPAQYSVSTASHEDL